MRAIGGKAYVPSHDSAEFYVQSYQTRHKDCNPKGPSNRTLRADLSVLGASRQLYEEANYILWTTNTFSFEDYVSFDAFVDSLTPAQKRDFRSLSISTDIGDMARSRNEYYADNYRWVYSFSTARIQSLRGLQCLYFCFELRYSSSFYLRLESSLKRRLEPFMRMRALPLKQVTVTISDDIFQILRYRIGERRLTAAMKNEYANDLRAQLFDPRGAEIMRAEFDALVVSYKRKWEETEAEALERAKKSAAYAEAKAGDRARIAEKATVRADEAAKKAE